MYTAGGTHSGRASLWTRAGAGGRWGRLPIAGQGRGGADAADAPDLLWDMLILYQKVIISEA